MCYMMRDSETHGRVKVVYIVCISGTVGRRDTASTKLYHNIFFHKSFVVAVGEYHQWLPKMCCRWEYESVPASVQPKQEISLSAETEYSAL
jgi:hypothetical protein